MSFFSNDEDNINEKISLDELYDRKREVEINRMNIYKRILNRVHTKIKMAARQKNSQDFTFFVVPEFIFGIPKYNIDTCVSYIIQKLEENGFLIKYTHPNLLYIYWGHYIPSYERAKIKKETGRNIDGFGNIVPENKGKNKVKFAIEDTQDINTAFLNGSNKQDQEKSNGKTKREFKDISTYKPKGIYAMDLINKIKDRLD